jgi:2-keto-4-pentenoate hydratase/2-oxohepta-3-ene-1,7-dioic acid hydratase in catechol pathway
MICHVMYFEYQQQALWGVLANDKLYPLDDLYSSTADFLERGRSSAYQLLMDVQQGSDLSGLHLDSVSPLSPVTSPCRVLCQGANYRQHMIDSGMDPDAKVYNMFFTKSSASVCPGSSDIVRPAHVELLDYEVELGLVMGKKVDKALAVTEHNLHEFVAGIVIGNDVSARDIQIPQTQFYKGKSYRTFCPVGPVLCLLQEEDMHYLDELQLELKVNGNTRQQDSSANLVFKPAETLSEFTQVSDLDIGDLILTGTPQGCAMQLSPSLVKQVYSMPEDTRWPFFIEQQKNNGRYLEPGDRLTASIRSADGAVDLGVQENLVRAAE